jgi:hypothetical protein
MAFTGEVIEIVKIRWVETGFSGARELHGARRMTIMVRAICSIQGLRLVVALIVVVLMPAASQAQDAVLLSPDTTVELSAMTFEDQEVVGDNQMGSVSLVPLGVLPEASDVNAYHLLPNGDQLYSLDTTAELGGGLTAGPADVVRYDGVTDTLEFDASAEGIPDGVIVDAVSVHGSGDLLLSFDTTVDLGGGVTAQDEDLVRFDGGSTYTVFFDGSAENVPAGLDLDGADYRASDGHLFLSFDASGSLGGVDFDDEDILEFDSGGPTWTLHYDGSGEHSELAAADVVAVPEPRGWLQLVAGIVLLGVLHRAPKWAS